LHIFSFFDAHDLQVWCFDGGTNFLHIPLALLSLLRILLFFFFCCCCCLITILSSRPEILSSTCSILLEL
jgi:hypothetical protein